MNLPRATSSAPPDLDLAALPPGAIEALYIHVPFCFHKCHYCDFYSITRQEPPRMDRYVDLLLREADQWARTGNLQIRPRTIFIGGGTPTLLPIPAMQRLLAGIRDRFDLSALVEWTVEANPATVTEECGQLLRSAGVDRLSFGAQSFDQAQLARLERHHHPDDVPRSLDIARRCGFTRLNLDLIYAIPGQSLESWLGSLQSAIDLGTTHISCYALTYEPNTPMAVKKRLGQFQPATDDLELQMFHATRGHLATAGLLAYEISNYAVPGQECLHNLMYWNGGCYAGLGPSAASHVRGVRWRNRPHLGEWETAIASDLLPATDMETLTPRRRAGELAMLQLRLANGIVYDDFAARTGFDARALYPDQLDTLARNHLLHVTPTGFRLTEQGLNVADAIAAEFLLT